VPALADHEMIEHVDIQQLAGFDELARDVNVFYTYMENLLDFGVREG
jgi:hypothetical protein